MRTAFLLLLLSIGTTLHAQSEPELYPITTAVLESPSTSTSYALALASSPDGDTYLSWITPTKENAKLYVARYDRTQQRWSQSQLITIITASGSSTVDTPNLAAGRNQTLAIVWLEKTQGGGTMAYSSRSSDAGITWAIPSALTSESDLVEFPTIAVLPNGEILAVWLDGRGNAESQPTRLYGRIIGSERPDVMIDDSVCDCCQISLTSFPNGDVLIAYRARREGEIRDIYTTLFQDGHWTEPRILSADGWRINGCPVNGPQLDSNGGNVAAIWFTGADNISRVYATTSPDAGLRFLMPQRIDLGKPLGRVDTVQLHDGSRIVTWVEGGGQDHTGIYLRRISDRDEVGPAIRLFDTASALARIALVKDYDATPAQLILSYTHITKPTGMESLLVTLPDLSTLAGRKPCLPCDEQDANATRGYPVKGVIAAVLANSQVQMNFEEIPGVMRATTLKLQVEPELHPKLPVGQELLGRIEQRGRDWWLFNMKLLGEPLR